GGGGGGAWGVVYEPLAAPVDPEVELVLGDERHRRFRNLRRQCMGLDYGEIGVDEDAAIETGDRAIDLEGINEHRHAARRPAARDGKADVLLMQRMDGNPCPFRQGLVTRDERPIHIGEEQGNSGRPYASHTAPPWHGG